MNDYADSKTGVDWSDSHFYKFFGGSKMIQQGLLSEKWYLKASLICAACAVLALTALFLLIGEPIILIISFASIILGWMYSHKPAALSHRCLGEVAIFIFFGLVPLGAGFYLQSGVIFPAKVVYASLPYSFLITAILFANEIPDLYSDLAANKRTWVSITGLEHAYILYIVLQIAGLISVIFCILRGIFASWTFVSVLFIIPAIKAALIIRRFPHDKLMLIKSSKITITEHAFVGIILLGGSV